jgi:hypothetical protein
LYKILNPSFSYDRFSDELKTKLAKSTGPQLKSYATQIISEEIQLKDLLTLLIEDEKAARHLRILISEVGIQNPEFLYKQLPELFEIIEEKYPKHLFAFSSWWHYCGVPEQNEAKAIDYLFKWFLSAEIKPYIKTRALWVLVKLSEKYPDIKQELKLCLTDQMDKYSKEFQKRARKITDKL